MKNLLVIALLALFMLNTAGQIAHAAQKPTFDKSKLIKSFELLLFPNN